MIHSKYLERNMTSHSIVSHKVGDYKSFTQGKQLELNDLKNYSIEDLYQTVNELLGTEGKKLELVDGDHKKALLEHFDLKEVKDDDGITSDLKTKQQIAEKVFEILPVDPTPKYSRVVSTYNLKALGAGFATFGSFAFGLTPVGLVLAGTAAFFASKFVASHVQSYKDLETQYKSLFNKEESDFYNKTKTFFKNGFSNIVSFMKSVTYKSVWQGMLNGHISRSVELDDNDNPKKEDDGAYKMTEGMLSFATYSGKSDGFDLKSLGLNAVAAAGSVLALMYAPIAAPLYRLATAVLPVALFSPLGNLAIDYNSKGSNQVAGDASKSTNSSDDQGGNRTPGAIQNPGTPSVEVVSTELGEDGAGESKSVKPDPSSLGQEGTGALDLDM
jgi:hypothetical protein